MSFEHSQTQYLSIPKKILPWYTNSTSGPYSHTHTLTKHGNRTQQKHTYVNYKSLKQLASNRIRMHTHNPHPSPPYINTTTFSQSACAHKKCTHLNINKLPSPLPTSPQNCLCAQTEITPTNPVAKLYQIELDYLPPITG